MPKGAGQKLKLYYLSQIMIKKTDDEHFLTMPEILAYLKEYGISADRKSVYDDLAALTELGIDIIGEQVGKKYYYHVGTKKFELAELMLLVDAIQSSKFITAKKSNELIKKITDLASEYEARQLKRQVVVQGRIKTMNESIYYIVDDIHRAMQENKNIKFEYLTWNINKKMVPRKEGFYIDSPWALTWDDENYYLIAYDLTDKKIKHFRVDKMRNITLTEDKRQGKELFEAYDMAAYAKMNFGMFGGKEITVSLQFRNDFVGIVIDRFGKDISIIPSDREGWSRTHVEVALSDQFFGWIFAMGGHIEITGPSDVVERFKAEIGKQSDIYFGK
ncbi:helix-turn-helix transcriptional regulator [Butyrivibrio sp. YAB3001]|uniref:helix-turn-helix transcriptional regulator n=1 Tax=Butyrivibrio sp. YAB3001 TaxID=1520812 RepID=UPI0008F61D4B|nr:WYL domain-containing protein [Butyrivibrio sp. YAB3001]SFB74272.1 Predicted DNA-binding transcriptional regulator YafY, contains an HTH and WYL domains [Butyrivibrio sp. YAB3001]